MESTYADSWSDMAQPCDMDLWVMKWRSAWPIFHGPVILSYILKTIWCMYIYSGSMNQYDPTFDLKINLSHCDLYSIVQWFCLISWRVFGVFGIMSQYNPKFDLKINIGHYDLYFMVQLFCLISWRLFDICTSYFGSIKKIWCMNNIIWDYESVWPKVWPQNEYRSLWPIFYGTVILHYILKTITSYFGIKSQYDLMFDLKINVGLCDIYFMVHWFYLISLSDLNYFYTLRNGTGWGYSCPSGHLL